MDEVTWRKSSHSSSAGDQCIEVAIAADGIAVRDSKDPDGPVLVVARAALREAIRLAAE